MLYRLSQISLRNFEGKLYPYAIVFHFGWAVKTFKANEFFYNSFLFGSTGFDSKFFASAVAR